MEGGQPGLGAVCPSGRCPHGSRCLVAFVFNIGGDDFRLVTRIVYVHHLVYVVEVLTHAEYDKRKW